MKRRQFITLLGGAAAWPIAARAQQGQRVRRVGLLMLLGSNDPEAQSDMAAFQQAIQGLGWTEGRDLMIDYRFGLTDRARYSKYAAELVALAPDVIVTGNGGIASAVRRASATVPIVFALAPDPVGSGLVESMARPGGNTTGFATSEYGESGKLLQLLKDIAPSVRRAAVIREPGTSAGTGTLGAIQTAAASIGVEVRPIGSRDADTTERGIVAFATNPNGGLVVPPTALSVIHRELIIQLAARYRLPAVYSNRASVTNGGLMSYGPVPGDRYRRAAGYVDRILRGEKPADLPVQAPTKYETVLNLKTAKSLGLTVPPNLLAIADEVIE